MAGALQPAVCPNGTAPSVVATSTAVRTMTPRLDGYGETRHWGQDMRVREQDRHTAVRRIARELRMELEEAERWCDAWERFAERQGVPPGPYFWDSGRGWIDAQRGFELADRSSTRRRAG